MAATAAPAARTRSAGASSISRPRRPPLQKMVANRSAEESTTTGSRFALAQRGDATGHVAGRPLGRGHAGQGRPLPARRGGERLEVELSRHRDHADRQRTVDLGHERLEHPFRRDAQRVAGLQAVGAAPRIVVIDVHGMRYTEPGQQRGRRCPLSCHACRW
jgi:hypothetical protein